MLGTRGGRRHKLILTVPKHRSWLQDENLQQDKDEKTKAQAMNKQKHHNKAHAHMRNRRKRSSTQQGKQASTLPSPKRQTPRRPMLFRWSLRACRKLSNSRSGCSGLVQGSVAARSSWWGSAGFGLLEAQVSAEQVRNRSSPSKPASSLRTSSSTLEPLRSDALTSLQASLLGKMRPTATPDP